MAGALLGVAAVAVGCCCCCQLVVGIVVAGGLLGLLHAGDAGDQGASRGARGDGAPLAQAGLPLENSLEWGGKLEMGAKTSID